LVVLSWTSILSKQFHRCNEVRNVQPKHTIYPPYLPELIRIRQVLTVPSYEKITSVIGRKRQMQSVTERISRHHFMRQIRFDDLEDGVFQFEHFQVVQHRHRIAASREITTAKFI